MSLLLYAFIIVVVIALAIYEFANDQRFRRIPVVRLADVRDGQLVKVVGRARGAMTAPFSGQPCVAYRIGARRRATRQKKLAGRAHFDKFILIDGDIEAEVDPAGIGSFGVGHLRLAQAPQIWQGDAVKALPDVLDLPKADLAFETILAVDTVIAVRALVRIRDGRIALVPDRGRMVVTDVPAMIGPSRSQRT